MNKIKREDEIQFKELLKNPLRLFGWIFPVFAVLVLALGVFFVKNLNDISYNEQVVGVPDTVNIKKDILLKKGGIMPAVDLAVVKNPTPEFTAKGKELYDANCKSCHGDSGMGDGAAGAMLNPKPRNFHAAEGWTNGRTIDMLYKTLQEGIIKNGMAAYEYLSPADRFAIISYIRTFAQYPEVTENELASLDQTYQLSKGTVVPNQIPVATAQMRIEEENSGTVIKIESAKKKIEDALLIRSAMNLDKALGSFTNGNLSASLESFIQIVSANPINYGFKPSVNQLSRDEFRKLYEQLKTLTM